MDLKDLHAEYGRLMVLAEITQANIQQIKAMISEEMKKPPVQNADTNEPT
jgi:hypothetical protein